MPVPSNPTNLASAIISRIPERYKLIVSHWLCWWGMHSWQLDPASEIVRPVRTCARCGVKRGW